MKRLLVLMCLFSPLAFPYASYSGWCEQGGAKVSVQGTSSTTYVQQSYPNFNQSAAGPRVTVYNTGTTDKVSVYSDNNGTPLSNPFPCSATGQYQFFADNGTYDLLFSGTGISSFTRSAIQVIDPASITKIFNVTTPPYNADRTGVVDATNAFIQAAADALAGGGCLYAPAGMYKLTGTSTVPAFSLTSTATANGCAIGDGPGQTVLLQSANSAMTVGIGGLNVVVEGMSIAKGSGVTGGYALVVYPDTTASGDFQEASYANVRNLAIDSAFCNVGPDNHNACRVAAAANPLAAGILIQSGVFDSLFNQFVNINIQHATDAIYLLSGGISGSSGGGIVNSEQFVNVQIGTVTNGFHLTSSLENRVSNYTCNFCAVDIKFDTQSAGHWTGQASEGNTFDVTGESSPIIVDWGSASALNTVITPLTLALNGYTNTGSAQANNTFVSPDNFQVGIKGTGPSDGYVTVGSIPNPTTPATATFQINSTANNKDSMRIASNGNTKTASLDYLHWNPFGSSVSDGTYTSGGSVTGTSGQVCQITITGGTVNATALISLTGTNTIAGGTAFTVTNGGVFTSAPTAGTLSTAPSPAPAAACSGSVVLATHITGTGVVENTASTFPYGSPMHIFRYANTNSSSNTRVITGPALASPAGNFNGDYAVYSTWVSGLVNGAINGSTYAALEASNSGGTQVMPFQVVGQSFAGSGGMATTTLGNAFGCTHGTNATCGVATLSSGTVTVATTAIGASGIGVSGVAVQLTLQNCSSCGTPYVSGHVNNTSFTISSTNGSDASNVFWQIMSVQ